MSVNVQKDMVDSTVKQVRKPVVKFRHEFFRLIIFKFLLPTTFLRGGRIAEMPLS